MTNITSIFNDVLNAALDDGSYVWPELRRGAPPPLPVTGLPTVAADMIRGVATALQVPRDLAWLAVVTSASAYVLDTTIEVAPGWSEPAVLWGMGAAGSGESKSPTLRLAIPGRPPVRCLEDATPEALATALECNPRAWLRTAEGASLSTVLGTRYGDGAASLLLQCFSGEQYVVDRKSGDSVVIDDPRVAVTAFVQPSVLTTLVNDARTRGQGAWARFLIVWPDSMVGRRKWREMTPLSKRVSARWSETLERARSSSKAPLPVQDAALTELLDYRQEVEERLVGEWSGITDWASKSAGHLIRLAGVVSRLNGHETVEPETVAGLRPTMDAFAGHMLRVLGSASSDPDAGRVRTFLRKHAGKTVSQRDVARGIAVSPGRAASLMRIMVDAALARVLPPPPRKRGRPPGPSWEVRPAELWPETE